MKKVLDFVKVWWGKLLWLVSQEAFLYSYPFVVLGLVCVISQNVFALLAFTVWVIATVKNVLTKKDNEEA
jgi:hypothetical protein